jgi:hypothetical protein
MAPVVSAALRVIKSVDPAGTPLLANSQTIKYGGVNGRPRSAKYQGPRPSDPTTCLNPPAFGGGIKPDHPISILIRPEMLGFTRTAW